MAPALTAPALTAPALTAPALTAPALTAPSLTHKRRSKVKTRVEATEFAFFDLIFQTAYALLIRGQFDPGFTVDHHKSSKILVRVLSHFLRLIRWCVV
jgi:hypothetical protein